MIGSGPAPWPSWWCVPRGCPTATDSTDSTDRQRRRRRPSEPFTEPGTERAGPGRSKGRRSPRGARAADPRGGPRGWPGTLWRSGRGVRGLPPRRAGSRPPEDGRRGAVGVERLRVEHVEDGGGRATELHRGHERVDVEQVADRRQAKDGPARSVGRSPADTGAVMGPWPQTGVTTPGPLSVSGYQ